MMRVLSVVHYPMFGGPHNRNMRLAPVLRGLGVDTTVLLPDEPGNAAARLTESGVDVRTLPLTRIRASRQLRPHVQLLRNFPAEVSAIRKLIEHLRIDVVQLNGLVNSQAAFAARRRRREETRKTALPRAPRGVPRGARFRRGRGPRGPRGGFLFPLGSLGAFRAAAGRRGGGGGRRPRAVRVRGRARAL